MTGYAIPTSPQTWDHSPWQRWVAEVAVPVGHGALRAWRLLAAWAAALLAVTLVWPARLAARWWRWTWVRPDRFVSTVVLAGPAGLLLRTAPRLDWPSSYAEALADVQVAARVLGVAFLILVALHVQAGGAGAAAKPLVASPDGTRSQRWLAAVHEAAHLVVARALGRRVYGAWLTSNSTGFAEVETRYDTDPIGEAAVDLAGGIGSGTWWGASADRDNARKATRGRSGGWSAALALSRRKCRENHREILRTARRLYDAPNGTVIR